nr:hypothetical protein [Tanacetum cinerariifolium]
MIKNQVVLNLTHQFNNLQDLSGGINRVKKHLAGRKGDVAPCTKVDPDVRFTMEGLLKENDHKLKQRGIEFAESNVISDDDEEQQPVESQPKTGKRKATTSYHPFFTKGIDDASQPTIKKAMRSKERFHDVDLAIAMWFYDVCIPMNATNSPYFQHAVDKIASVGFGYKAPSYHALRVNLLADAKNQFLC